MILSILITSTPDRTMKLSALLNELADQIQKSAETRIQVLINSDSKYQTIGEKRNWLLQNSQGDYVAFIDSDDQVTPVYIETLLEGIKRDVDCVSLRGLITENGQNPQIFEHALKYSEYKTNDDETTRRTGIRYERFANHLNCIRASIVKQFKFPEKNFSEDTDWATMVHKSGLIKTEYYHQSIIYNYQYIPNK